MQKNLLLCPFYSSFFIPCPIGDVGTTSRWYFSGPSNPFVARSLAFLGCSPDKCFSKLSFFTDNIPVIQLVLNLLMFLIWLSYLAQMTHLTFTTFPHVNSFSNLHLKLASQLSTAFRLVILIALYFQHMTLSLIIFIYWTNEVVDWTLFTCCILKTDRCYKSSKKEIFSLYSNISVMT